MPPSFPTLRASDPAEVIGAITGGMLGRIAVTYIEWAGARHTRTVADWTLIDSAASARALSASLAKAPIETELWTSISHAIKSEEHTSELQSLMRISYAVFCLKKKNIQPT